MGTLQEDCDRIAGRMKKLHEVIEDVIAGTTPATKLRFYANTLHRAQAQGFVNHAEPAGADWDQMAAATYAGPIAPPDDPAYAGAKHKPTPNA